MLSREKSSLHPLPVNDRSYFCRAIARFRCFRQRTDERHAFCSSLDRLGGIRCVDAADGDNRNGRSFCERLQPINPPSRNAGLARGWKEMTGNEKIRRVERGDALDTMNRPAEWPGRVLSAWH